MRNVDLKKKQQQQQKPCSCILGSEREFPSLPWENLSGQVIKRKVQATRRIKLPDLPRCLFSCSLWISKQVVWPGWLAARVTVTFSVLSWHCPIHVRTANLTLKISPGRRPWERLAPSHRFPKYQQFSRETAELFYVQRVSNLQS